MQNDRENSAGNIDPVAPTIEHEASVEQGSAHHQGDAGSKQVTKPEDSVGGEQSEKPAIVNGEPGPTHVNTSLSEIARNLAPHMRGPEPTIVLGLLVAHVAASTGVNPRLVYGSWLMSVVVSLFREYFPKNRPGSG